MKILFFSLCLLELYKYILYIFFLFYYRCLFFYKTYFWLYLIAKQKKNPKMCGSITFNETQQHNNSINLNEFNWKNIINKFVNLHVSIQVMQKNLILHIKRLCNFFAFLFFFLLFFDTFKQKRTNKINKKMLQAYLSDCYLCIL